MKIQRSDPSIPKEQFSKEFIPEDTQGMDPDCLPTEIWSRVLHYSEPETVFTFCCVSKRAEQIGSQHKNHFANAFNCKQTDDKTSFLRKFIKKTGTQKLRMSKIKKSFKAWQLRLRKNIDMTEGEFIVEQMGIPLSLKWSDTHKKLTIKAKQLNVRIVNAIKNSEIETLRVLLRSSFTPQMNNEKQTPLMLAASLGNFEVFKALYEETKELKKVIPFTALQYNASDAGNLQILQFLVNKHPMTDRQKRICLNYARRESRENIVTYLTNMTRDQS